MPLLPVDSVTPERPPWRGLVVGVLATLAFILTLAFIARATRDNAGGVPDELRRSQRIADAGVADAGFASDDDAEDAEDVLDAGVAAGQDAGSDAGAVGDAGPDGGSLHVVEPEPPTGPAGVQGPPVDVAAVTQQVLPIVEKCLQGALRFDPSLGGKAKLTIVVKRGKATATFDNAPSPVLATCLADNARALPVDAKPAEPVQIVVRVVLDGLRGQVKLESSELVLTP